MAKKTKESRVDIISKINTPLSYFALVSLIIEGVLGALAIKINTESQLILVYGMIGTLVLLIIVVGYIGFKKPGILTSTSELIPPINCPVKLEDFFQKEYPDTMNEYIKSSELIYMIGVTLRGTSKKYYIELEKKARSGNSINFLLVDPNCFATVTTVTKRGYWQTDPNRMQGDIIGTINDLCKLKNIPGNKVEIRVIDYPIAYGVIIAKNNNSSDVLFVEHYPYKTKDNSVPKFILHHGSFWYSLYESEIMNLWSSGREWHCGQETIQ